MCKKLMTLTVVAVLAMGTIAQAANIMWVSDNTKYDFDANQPADAGFVDLLRAQGHNVIYKGEVWPYDPNDDNVILNPDWRYWQTLDANKIDELNAADLVIISRIASSGAYDDVDAVTGFSEPNGWNSVTAPMICMSAHLARSSYNKWGWLNTEGNSDGGHPYNKDTISNILDPNHPIFEGITVDSNSQAELITGDYTVNGSSAADAGNGITLTTRASDNAIMIATWEAGLKYFEGSGYVAGGSRMFFAAGSGNGSPRDGIYNLTSDGETVFLNAVNYMLASLIPPMVAHWPMDDGAGTVVTDVVGSNDGTMVGNVSWIDGILGGAVTFDNSDPNAAIAIPHSEVLDFGDVDFSISLMVRYPIIPGDPEHQLIMKGSFGSPDSGSRYTLFNKNAEFRFEIDNGPANIKSGIKIANAPVVTGEWVHVVLVRDAVNDLLEMYIDGILLTSGTDNSGDISSGEEMRIGNTTVGNDRTCEADIDDVRIFDVALTESEIAAIASLY